jgi:LysR family hydrogen peroxide-inducible transcriptional activator
LILQLTERLTDELLAQVKSGHLDAALISGAPETSGIKYIPLFIEPFFLLAPASHRIAQEKSLCMDKLSVDEMVLMDEGHCLRDQALDLCDAPKFGRPSIVATSFETLRHLVASGWGYTLFPSLAIRDDPSLDPMLAYLEFRDGSPSREIGLAYRSGSARETDTLTLATHLREHLPEGTILCQE